MLLISHRGNTSGPDRENENRPEWVEAVIRSGLDCEVDVWLLDDKHFFLGHDNPERRVDFQWFIDHKEHLWIHAKNLWALDYMWDGHDLNVFWQENDRFSMTSKGYIWTNVGEQCTNRSVLVTGLSDPPPGVFGICSDFVDHFML